MEGRVEPPVYLGPDELARLYSVEDFESLARERMADAGYRYVAGWAGTGETVRLNREAFGRWVLRPRALVDVSTIDPSTTVLGQPVSLPVLFAPSALHRLTRDVLVRRGLRHVILLEGVNDLRSSSPPATADQIIAGYRQIIQRVHDKGARIYGATLTPIEGSGGYSAAMEAERQKLNTFIRTSGAFDGVVDFDRATRDPADPLRFLPAFDSGDHLHPNDAGYQAMAGAVDLSLFG